MRIWDESWDLDSDWWGIFLMWISSQSPPFPVYAHARWHPADAYTRHLRNVSRRTERIFLALTTEWYLFYKRTLNGGEFYCHEVYVDGKSTLPFRQTGSRPPTRLPTPIAFSTPSIGTILSRPPDLRVGTSVRWNVPSSNFDAKDIEALYLRSSHSRHSKSWTEIIWYLKQREKKENVIPIDGLGILVSLEPLSNDAR